MALIQEIIERSIFEAIRLLLVADGHTPDITNTSIFPNTPEGYRAYLATLKHIRDTRGYAIEVFGTSNPDDKGTKDLPRITLQTSAFLPGEVGIDTTPFPTWNPETNKYDLYSYDSRTYDLFIDCNVSAKTQAQLRVLMDVVHRALPLMGYLPFYNDPVGIPNDTFFMQATAFQPLVSPVDGVLEYNYRYEVPDVVWRELTKEPTPAIAPINEITLNLQIEERLGISTKIT